MKKIPWSLKGSVYFLVGCYYGLKMQKWCNELCGYVLTSEVEIFSSLHSNKNSEKVLVLEATVQCLKIANCFAF